MIDLRTVLMTAAAAAVLTAAATAEDAAKTAPVQDAAKAAPAQSAQSAQSAQDVVKAVPTHMRVVTDQSALLHLDRPAKTVIVGNSSIAEAQLVTDRTIYVLGRIFGNTNIIAIDAEGSEVANTRITVGAAENQQVTVYRGPAGQRNLACAPHCERIIMPGDAEMGAIYDDANKKTDISAKGAAMTAGK
jgi:Flp pilus assembly secretin CpaC